MKHGYTNGEDPLPVAERIAYLIAGFLRNSLTEEEHDELDDWVVASDENTRLFEELTDPDNLEAMLEWRRHVDQQKTLNQIKENIGLRRPGKSFLHSLWPMTIAVACLLAVAAGAYFWIIREKDNDKAAVQNSEVQNAKPGTDKAVLTLASGRTIILDSGGAGLLANEGNISIKKGQEGELIYDGTDTEMKYNIVSTPRGGQYKIVLGDGTRVWLNAESSLKFPAGFSLQHREVEIRGEGYFEVAKNAERPFKVKIVTPWGDGGLVEVLGTHFNINSYGDEAMVKTTLLEGSVRVTLRQAQDNNHSVVLQPGQQVQSNGNNLKIVAADTGKETAWKEGKFVFSDATIQNIAGQIARWYDVEVEYSGKIPYHFNATIDRDEPLENVLTALEATKNVQFTLEGKKLIIRPRSLK
jgi:transmembrane sensor